MPHFVLKVGSKYEHFMKKLIQVIQTDSVDRLISKHSPINVEIPDVGGSQTFDEVLFDTASCRYDAVDHFVLYQKSVKK